MRKNTCFPNTRSQACQGRQRCPPDLPPQQTLKDFGFYPKTSQNTRRVNSPGGAKRIVSPPRFIPVVSWGPVCCLKQALNLSLIIKALKLSKQIIAIFNYVLKSSKFSLKFLTSVFCRGSPLRSLGMMDRRDAMRAIVESREGRRSPLISGVSSIWNIQIKYPKYPNIQSLNSIVESREGRRSPPISGMSSI